MLFVRAFLRDFSLSNAIALIGLGSGFVGVGAGLRQGTHPAGGFWLIVVGSVLIAAAIVFYLGHWAVRNWSLDALPKIEVFLRARPDYSDFLVVKNLGGTAAFAAQIHARVNDRIGPNPSDYTGYWEEARGGHTTILNGHSDRILLRTHRMEPDGQGRDVRLTRLFAADPASHDPKIQDSSNWGGWILTLTVTISSEPPLAAGPFIATYEFPSARV